MNEQKNIVFKKLLTFALSKLSYELSKRGCNDVSENDLKLTQDEKQIALEWLNQNKDTDEIKDDFEFDFEVVEAIRNYSEIDNDERY